MKVCMIHDLDTGFLAQTLKPAFIELGHDCYIIQTTFTGMEPSIEHIDYLLKDMEDKDILLLEEEFKDTDLFIIRSISDFTLKVTGILKYTTKHNTIYRVHGSELREKNVPYSLRTWMVDWYGNEPIIVGPRDPSLIHKYKGNVVTHIERPLSFNIIPNKRKKGHYALTTPTNLSKKGTDELMSIWGKDREIPLYVLSGHTREDTLKYKAGCSYYIDRLGTYEHGPYGMNSVEAWYLKIPVFSEYSLYDTVVCPELPKLVNNVTIDNVYDVVSTYNIDKKALDYAYKYTINTHSPIVIAQQYISLGIHIGST
jgi:hypothetical protein